MNKKIRVLCVILIILLGIILAGERQVNAQPVDYLIIRSIISSGGGTVSENNFSISNTLGQPFTGTKFSEDYQIGSGFWTSLINHITDFLFIYLPLILK